MLVYGTGAAFFSLEPEPTQSGRSRSRLQDLGLPEPEPQSRNCLTALSSTQREKALDKHEVHINEFSLLFSRVEFRGTDRRTGSQ